MKRAILAAGVACLLSGCLATTGKGGPKIPATETLALAEVHQVIDYVKQQIRVFDYHLVEIGEVDNVCSPDGTPTAFKLTPAYVQLDVKTDHKGTVKLEAGTVLASPPGVIASGSATRVAQQTNTVSLLLQIEDRGAEDPPEPEPSGGVDWSDLGALEKDGGLAWQLFDLAKQLQATDGKPPCLTSLPVETGSKDTGMSVTLAFVLSREVGTTGGYNFIVVKAQASDTKYAAYTNTVKVVLTGKVSALAG